VASPFALACFVVVGMGIAAQEPAPERAEKPAARPSAQATAAGVDAVLAELVAVGTSHERFARCEQHLGELPAGDVLPALAVHPMRAMPGGGIWNSGGVEHDRAAPHPWRVFYALERIESHLERNAPIGELRRGRARATGGDPDDPAVTLWLAGIHRVQGEEAVTAARAVFDAERRPLGERVQAAGLLLDLDAHASYARVSEFAVANDRIDALLDKLGRRYEPPIPVDRRVVSWAFTKLEADVAQNPDYVHVAYFTARRLEGIVRQEFAPNAGDPRWRSPTGLKDEFFRTTVERARAWWREHRAEFEH
jgi:hypothetical protein